MKFNTTLLHGKAVPPYEHGSTLPGLSQAVAYQFPSAQAQADVFANKTPGFAYTRVANPTIQAFERRINEIEGGASAVATSSGMSAINLALLNMLSAGDEIIAGSGMYGGTIELLEDLRPFGLVTRYVTDANPDQIEALINDKTRVIFAELIGNPSLRIMDVRQVADLSHRYGLPLIVDATTATPFLAKPLKLGADIVIHSTTKYINGSGNSVGGVIVDGGKFKWTKERYPALEKYVKFGPMAYTARLRTGLGENLGGCMAPANAYLTTLGLETLGLRMERICDNAVALAGALTLERAVEVNYPTLPGHPYREIASWQLGGRGGGLITIRVGTKERAYKILDALTCAVRATSLGDVRTLVIHPASTILAHVSDEVMHAAGVYEDTIRISVGIEDVEDLIEDFHRAIAKADAV